MSDISKVVYIDSDSYFNSPHEESVLYLVDYSTRLGIFYDDKESTNIVECTEIPEDLVKDCFYVLRNSSEVRLYYSVYLEELKKVQVLPVFDSTIKSFSVIDGSVHFEDQSESRVAVGIDRENSLIPSSISSQIVNSIGVLDLVPHWSTWR